MIFLKDIENLHLPFYDASIVMPSPLRPRLVWVITHDGRSHSIAASMIKHVKYVKYWRDTDYRFAVKN